MGTAHPVTRNPTYSEAYSTVSLYTVDYRPNCLRGAFLYFRDCLSTVDCWLVIK